MRLCGAVHMCRNAGISDSPRRRERAVNAVGRVAIAGDVNLGLYEVANGGGPRLRKERATVTRMEKEKRKRTTLSTHT
jgi:hypothetical protein